MEGCKIFTICITVLMMKAMLMVAVQGIPTTLDGPFKPVTRRFDPALRLGSDDLPMDHPRLQRKVMGMFPEQIALALSTPTSMWVSWITGEAQIGLNITALDPSKVASEVWYGKESGKYSMKKTGVSMVYSQLYPFEGLWNYTSGIIHHVRIDGLEPETKYYYKCGDSSLPAMSEEHVFETLQLPSPSRYPHRIAIVGDLGLTSNSTTTIDHLTNNDPSMILMVGDLTYANQYLTTGGQGASCYSCKFPDAPIRETFQPRWDGWGRFMEPLTSRIPMMVIEGNHEIEPQAAGVTFKSYLTRFSVPSEESGSSSNFFYSFDAGGVHFIMLGAYIDYNRTGSQYDWLLKDLHRIDRSVTPWVVASWHPPWYNSYSSHYQEFECMRLEMEEILYSYRIDIVFSGHVHAYERMNRVYNYSLDPCGPVYITIGDGGNIEKVDVDHADEPGKCPSARDNIPEFGGVCHFNFSSGPAKGKFCWDRQPEWSAYRESSFGHGILEVVNSTHALWTWHRNQDIYGENNPGDEIYIVRQPELCSIASQGNGFNSAIPLWLSHKTYLTNLHLAGDISLLDRTKAIRNVRYLTLNDNMLTGSIPRNLCKLQPLQFIDLSNNHLARSIPSCLGNLRYLSLLNHGNNTLSSHIPSSIGNMERLIFLHLNENKFINGDLPPSLRNLKRLQVLDVGGNGLQGLIPAWSGIKLLELRVLRLQSNGFLGNITLQHCQLSNLQLLNLGENKLTRSSFKAFKFYEGERALVLLKSPIH